MADLIQGISYKQLRRVSDWQMTQEAQRAALAAVVHAISRLDTTIYWGEGRTSASDGQRFALPRRVLQQSYSTCFSEFALEFYTCFQAARNWRFVKSSRAPSSCRQAVAIVLRPLRW